MPEPFITLQMVEGYAATLGDDEIAGDFGDLWACPVARVGEIAFGEPFKALYSYGRIESGYRRRVGFGLSVTALIDHMSRATEGLESKFVTGKQLREYIASVKREG